MASKTIPLLFFILVLIAEKGVDATIGVNWGRESAQRLIPSMVVDLLLQNNVKEARIYSSREDQLRAFAGSGIGLSISMSDLGTLQNYSMCKIWVRARMRYFNVSSIRRVYPGIYPFTMGMKDKAYLTKGLNAQRDLQKALARAGWGEQIKTALLHTSGELKDNITKPSEAEFRDEIKLEMAANLRFLQENDAPFVIEIVPPALAEQFNLDPMFAFVEDTGIIVKDINGAVYTNVFEFTYDCFVWATSKLGTPNVKIIVGQVGWPTDGYRLGNISTTERFFKGLLPFVASNKGTPLRPGEPIDTFVHSLTDENKLPDPFMRHWGIYRSNGRPKFKIDLSGGGRDIYPTSAKGIMRMPERWCVFNGNRSDYPQLMKQVEFACKHTDCSRLRPSGSCGHLDFNQNISYVFNSYFQNQFQNEKACNFEGLSYITVERPSVANCNFPIEVVEGEQENYLPLWLRTPSQLYSGYYRHNPNCFVSLFLFSFIGVLLWN